MTFINHILSFIRSGTVGSPEPKTLPKKDPSSLQPTDGFQPTPLTPIEHIHPKNIPLFGKQTGKQIEVTVTVDEKEYRLQLDVGTEKQRISFGPHHGVYWAKPLREGGIFYTLYFSETDLPMVDGKPSGVIGFQGKSDRSDFQTFIGLDAENGSSVRAPVGEYENYANWLSKLHGGFHIRGMRPFDFLKDNRDLYLTEGVYRYLYKLAQLPNGATTATFATPIFENVRFDKATQKKRWEELFKLDHYEVAREITDQEPALVPTLASLEALYDVVMAATEAKLLEWMSAVTAAALLAPQKGRATLEMRRLLEVIDRVANALNSPNAYTRMGAYTTLSRFLEVNNATLHRYVANAYLKQPVGPLRKKDSIEGERSLLYARISFESALAQKMQHAPFHIRDAIWGKLTGSTLELKGLSKNLLQNPSNTVGNINYFLTVIAHKGIEALKALPVGNAPYRPAEQAYVEALAKTLTLVTSINPAWKDQWNEVARVILNKTSDQPTSGKRETLLALINQHALGWLQHVAGYLRADLEPGYIPAPSDAANDNLVYFKLVRRSYEGPPQELWTRLLEKTLSPSDQRAEFERLARAAEAEYPEMGEQSSAPWANLLHQLAKRYENLQEDYNDWIKEEWARTHDPRLIDAVSGQMFGDDAAKTMLDIADEILNNRDIAKTLHGRNALRAILDRYGRINFARAQPLAIFLINEAVSSESLTDKKSLGLAINDLYTLQVDGLFPKEKFSATAHFYEQALRQEPFSPRTFAAAKHFQQLASGQGVQFANLSHAVTNLEVRGQIPSESVMSASEFYDTIANNPDPNARRIAAENGKYIYLNQQDLDRLRQGTFNPERMQDWQLVAQGLQLGMHDHSQTVADEAHRSYSYSQLVIAPATIEGDIKPMLLLGNTPDPAKPHQSSDMTVIIFNFKGEKISDRTVVAAREILTKIPLHVKNRFIGVERHSHDKRKHASGLQELVVPDGRTRRGEPLRYRMELYEDVDIDTIAHAAVHPLFFHISDEDREAFTRLHADSSDPADFAEEYGKSDADEDWATIGNAWIRNSQRTLAYAVDTATKGHPRFLQKLLIFLRNYADEETKIPTSEIHDDLVHSTLEPSSFAAKRERSLITEIQSSERSRYTFGYEGRQLVEVQGMQIRKITPQNVTPLPSPKIEYHKK